MGLPARIGVAVAAALAVADVIACVFRRLGEDEIPALDGFAELVVRQVLQERRLEVARHGIGHRRRDIGLHIRRDRSGRGQGRKVLGHRVNLSGIERIRDMLHQVADTAGPLSLLPGFQLGLDVFRVLPGQGGKRFETTCTRAMACLATRDVFLPEPVDHDLAAFPQHLLVHFATTRGRFLKRSVVPGDGTYLVRAQALRLPVHDGVGALATGKCLELLLQVRSRLAGKAREPCQRIPFTLGPVAGRTTFLGNDLFAIGGGMGDGGQSSAGRHYTQSHEKTSGFRHAISLDHCRMALAIRVS